LKSTKWRRGAPPRPDEGGEAKSMITSSPSLSPVLFTVTVAVPMSWASQFNSNKNDVNKSDLDPLRLLFKNHPLSLPPPSPLSLCVVPSSESALACAPSRRPHSPFLSAAALPFPRPHFTCLLGGRTLRDHTPAPQGRKPPEAYIWGAETRRSRLWSLLSSVCGEKKFFYRL
jgi:hypothetical protein